MALWWVNGESSCKSAYAILKSTTPESLPLQQSTADPYRLGKNPSTALSQSLGSLGPVAHKVCLNPLVGMGFDSKCDFAPPTILLGLLSCWGSNQGHPQEKEMQIGKMVV